MSFKEELERAIRHDGFKTIEELVLHLLKDKKMTFVDLTKYIQDHYGVDRTYSGIYAALRKFAPDDFDIRTRFEQSRERQAKSRGYNSFKEMLTDFANRRLSPREITDELGLKSSVNVRNLGKKYSIQLGANHRTMKAGFSHQARYRKWLDKAKELGYDSVEEALTDMKKGGIAVKAIAETFGVSTQSLWRRMKLIQEKQAL